MLVAKSQQDFIQFFLFDIGYSLTNKELRAAFRMYSNDDADAGSWA